MLHFEIEDISHCVVHDHFDCASVNGAIYLFYKFCAERLHDDHSRYVLYLLSNSGDELCALATYDDFLNHVIGLLRVTGGI